MAARRREHPFQILGRRLQQGFYGLGNAVLVSIIGGTFILKLSLITTLMGVSASLWLYAAGFVLEVCEKCFPAGGSDE